MSHPVEIDPILLSKVSKPARYVGGEWNSVVKDHDAVKLTVAYCFPDVYEVAMSHLGLRILYALLNERPDVAAERVYAPWPDMEEVMRSQGYPLFSLETKTPVRDFDMVGFTLQYESTAFSWANRKNRRRSWPIRSSPGKSRGNRAARRAS